MELERQPAHWGALFPAGTPVVALPSWRRPRLLVPAGSSARIWAGTRFYPAYRWTGRAYHVVLRLRALTRAGARSATGSGASDLLSEFLRDVAPHAVPAAVQVGMPGCARKLTAQLVDADGRVVGFLKCADQPLARERLRHEHDILRRLPNGAGPTPRKFGTLGGHDLLLLAPVVGRHPPSTLEPPAALHRFLDALVTPESLPLERHPWYLALGDAREAVARQVDAIASRAWAVTFRHGDLAPWNLLGTATGALVAIDWEYGSAAGLPGLDLAQYVLQVAMLIARAAPATGRAAAADALAAIHTLALSPRERSALVALAAYETYRAASIEGIGDDDARQVWRRAVWERWP